MNAEELTQNDVLLITVSDCSGYSQTEVERVQAKCCRRRRRTSGFVSFQVDERRT